MVMTMGDAPAPLRPWPKSCREVGCDEPHWHPVTGAEPTYHRQVYNHDGDRHWVPRYSQPVLKGKDPLDRFYTVADVADRMGVTAWAVRKWIAKGLPASRAGARGHFRIKGEDLKRWLLTTDQAAVPIPAGGDEAA